MRFAMGVDAMSIGTLEDTLTEEWSTPGGAGEWGVVACGGEEGGGNDKRGELGREREADGTEEA